MSAPHRARARTHNTTLISFPRRWRDLSLRARTHDVPPDVNVFWQNPSFHNYADYALSQAFHRGLARLRALGHEQRCAIMCAEAVWWRCHRRIIADYLIAAGETVFHILGPDRIEPARMTAAAQPRTDGSLVYRMRGMI